MIKTITVLAVLFSAISAQAQVLTTADTLGRGKQAVVVSENELSDSGLGINVAYAMYIRGVSDKADLYVSVGETHLLGQDQAYAGIGGNAQLLHAKGISVSLFGLASMPLHKQDQACTVLANAAVVVSRALNSRVSIYSGLNTLIPIGARERGLFTPPSNRINVPAGAALTFGDWSIIAEADLGKLRAVGLALGKTF